MHDVTAAIIDEVPSAASRAPPTVFLINKGDSYYRSTIIPYFYGAPSVTVLCSRKGYLFGAYICMQYWPLST